MEPVAIETPFYDTVDGGRCHNCGSVYIYDRSGRMLGEAMANALAYAYDWDYDAAFKTENAGYQEAVVRFDKKFSKYMLEDDNRHERGGKYFFIKRNK